MQEPSRSSTASQWILQASHSRRAFRPAHLTATAGSVTSVADAWQGKLNSPNDVIARSDSALRYGSRYGGNPNELGFQGVFRVSPAGALSLVTEDMFRPNGIALSPDEKTLVCDSEQNFVRKYDLAADGTINPQKFADTAPTPDGMAVDLQGISS
ncbi:MAG: SMP-30/gluconolactonase/LRE family protein [Polyangiaceae bacterium]